MDHLTDPEFSTISPAFNKRIDNDVVNVFNFADMDYKEIASVINSPDTTICAWCFSERNPAVRLALLLGELKE